MFMREGAYDLGLLWLRSCRLCASWEFHLCRVLDYNTLLPFDSRAILSISMELSRSGVDEHVIPTRVQDVKDVKTRSA